MAAEACIVDGHAGETCTTPTVAEPGVGVTFTDARNAPAAVHAAAGPATLVTGNQIAQERIYEPLGGGAAVLLYAVGDMILAADAARLGIVEGRVRLPDNADVAPTEKARRGAQNKARIQSTVEDKAVTLNG